MTEVLPSATKDWPSVLGEFDTIRKCLQGYNLARFGDGELKLMFGQGYSREPPNFLLGRELRRVFQQPHSKCIVGMPTMDQKGPKYRFIEPTNGRLSGWIRHMPRFIELLNGTSVTQYYSAFVTRPDSAPWIRVKEYAELVERLWRDKFAIVVCEKHGKIFKAVAKRAGGIVHIPCPHEQAYEVIAKLEDQCVLMKPDIVVISAGPTATCLANRLAMREVHAVDLGSCGRWVGELLGVYEKTSKVQ